MNISKKNLGLQMRASKLSARVISRFRDVLEGSINVQIEFLDVNFYILNKGVYTLDDFPNLRKMSLKSRILT